MVVPMKDKYVGTKKLRGQVVVVVRAEEKNVMVQSLTYPNQAPVIIPYFYFKETFKKIGEDGVVEREPTLLKYTEVEDIMIVVDETLRQGYQNKLISEEVSHHLCKMIAYNIISILGDVKETKK